MSAPPHRHNWRRVSVKEILEARQAARAARTAAATASEDPLVPGIALFGDSLTEYSFAVPNGFGGELERRLRGQVNVFNFGYAGRTSRNLRTLFADTIVAKLDEPPLLFTIWLGANDATLGPSAHVPIDEFEGHMRAYVDQIINHPSWNPKPKVLVISTPPIDVGHGSSESDEDDGMDLGPAFAEATRTARESAAEGIGHRTWASKRKYAQRTVALAESYPADAGVAALDMWTVLTQAGCDARGIAWEEGKLPGCGLSGAKSFPVGWFGDGLHFGSEGYKVVTAAIIGKIKETWPGLVEGLE